MPNPTVQSGGMSAVARYFLAEGWAVGGYDRVESELTRRLAESGAEIHYDDDVRLIPSQFLDAEHTAVVYTPAVPAEHTELAMFRERGFEVMKRSQMLPRRRRPKRSRRRSAVPCLPIRTPTR